MIYNICYHAKRRNAIRRVCTVGTAIYILDYDTVIVTGYRPFGNICIEHDAALKWEKRARDIVRAASDTNGELNKLLQTFTKEVTKGVEIMDIKTFDLPCFDSHKSFYGKAKCIELENGEKLLKSYNTIVAKITNDGTVVRLWDGDSQTTRRHFYSFLKFYNLPFMQWDKLEVQHG